MDGELADVDKGVLVGVRRMQEGQLREGVLHEVDEGQRLLVHHLAVGNVGGVTALQKKIVKSYNKNKKNIKFEKIYFRIQECLWKNLKSSKVAYISGKFLASFYFRNFISMLKKC